MKSPTLTKSARGKNCTFRLTGVCNHDSQTTVFCHAPSGSGMGLKSPDFWGAYGCSACHSVMDRQDKRYLNIDIDGTWLTAIAETQRQMAMAGLLIFSEKQMKPKRTEKVMQRTSLYRT